MEDLKVTLGLIPENSIDNVVSIEQFSITYGQQADCNSNRDDYQSLKITARNSDIDENGWYFNLDTCGGHWSVNNPEDIAKIVEDFKMRMQVATIKEKDIKTFEFKNQNNEG